MGAVNRSFWYGVLFLLILGKSNQVFGACPSVGNTRTASHCSGDIAQATEDADEEALELADEDCGFVCDVEVTSGSSSVIATSPTCISSTLIYNCAPISILQFFESPADEKVEIIWNWK